MKLFNKIHRKNAFELIGSSLFILFSLFQLIQLGIHVSQTDVVVNQSALIRAVITDAAVLIAAFYILIRNCMPLIVTIDGNSKQLTVDYTNWSLNTLSVRVELLKMKEIHLILHQRSLFFAQSRKTRDDYIFYAIDEKDMLQRFAIVHTWKHAERICDYIRSCSGLSVTDLTKAYIDDKYEYEEKYRLYVKAEQDGETK